MSIPEIALRAAVAIVAFAALAYVSRRSLTDARATTFAALLAVPASLGMAFLLPMKSVAAFAFFQMALGARAAEATPVRILSPVLALLGLVDPPFGIAAIALSPWRPLRSWQPAVEGAIALLVLVVGGQGASREIALLAGALGIAWAIVRLAPPFGALPRRAFAKSLLFAGAAVALLALIVFDRHGARIAGDDIGRGLLAAVGATVVGGGAAVVLLGLGVLLPVRDPARPLVQADLGVVLLIMLLGAEAAAGVALPGVVLCAGAGGAFLTREWTWGRRRTR